jgi:hypothetical protein
MRINRKCAAQILATAALSLTVVWQAQGSAADTRELPPTAFPAQASPQPVSPIPSAIWTSAGTATVWKRITLGTYKDVNLLREDLDSIHCGVVSEPQVASSGSIGIGTVKPRRPPCTLGESASEIIGRPAFKLSRTRTQIDLVVLTAADLGLARDEGVSVDAVYTRAELLGFALCPAETGPQLRLQYLDQRVGEFLHIAMRPIARWTGEQTSFTVANGGAGLLLAGSDGNLDLVVPPMLRFVFVRPQ